MALTEITAVKEDKEKGTKKSATIGYNFGDSLADMVKMFGENVVMSNAKKSMVITAQAVMRRYLEAGKDQAAITTSLAAWKPGVALERIVDPVGSITANWDKLDKTQKAALLAKLKA
jgi:hypothetical protein